MKNVCWVCAAMAAQCATSAFAADLPVKAGPIVAPVYNWTGFYVGASGGWIWNDTDQSVNVTGPAASAAAQNAIARSMGFGHVYSLFGGAQAGYNWQVNPAWVLGVEADILGTNITESNSITNLVPVVGAGSQDLTTMGSRRLDWMGTARARVGWSGINNLLLYGTGGLAYGGGSETIGVASVSGVGGGAPFSLVSKDSSIRVGWTAGGGLEMAVSPNWTFKWEYLYYDLGRDHVSVSQTVTPAFTASSDSEFRGGLVRVGINYKFGAAPLVAKY
jgi:outer membrane immunogenic protein